MDRLPVTLQPIINSATVTPITVGHSVDAVYRVETQSDETCYLKIGPSLQAEAERLQWLENRLPVPRVLHFEIKAETHYLLTSALDGTMLFESNLDNRARIDVLAKAAHMWHALPADDCPFLWTTHEQIHHARERLHKNRVDETDFAIEFYGKSAHELFADLLNAIPDDTQDSVVCHGDLTLPNILVDDSTGYITGFVDVGGMGVSDRHLDMVLAARSLWWNMGGAWVQRFYDAYGIAFDPAKYQFYSILNEFF